MMIPPIFYSDRNCPYCMRAHMALKYAKQKVILREVEVSDLPAEALAVSAHATVPSLVIDEKDYLDESWDIVKWAVQKNDPEGWLGANNKYLRDAEMLVETTDYSFKEDLDQYKNADGQSEQPAETYRQRGEEFLEELNQMLEENEFLLSSHITIADIAVFPFIREFAMVDQDWFSQAPYPKLRDWLTKILETEWFKEATKLHKTWQPGGVEIYV